VLEAVEEAGLAGRGVGHVVELCRRHRFRSRGGEVRGKARLVVADEAAVVLHARARGASRLPVVSVWLWAGTQMGLGVKRSRRPRPRRRRASRCGALAHAVANAPERIAPELVGEEDEDVRLAGHWSVAHVAALRPTRSRRSRLFWNMAFSKVIIEQPCSRRGSPAHTCP